MRRRWTSLAAVLGAVLLTAQVALAHDSGFGLVRYNADGTLDASFGNDGILAIRSTQRNFIANTLALEPDGQVLLAGLTSDATTGAIQLAIARFNSGGAADPTFGSDGIVSTVVGDGGGQANAAAVQTDGMIVVGGTAFSRSGSDQFLVARYRRDGVLDQVFGAGGRINSAVGAGAASVSAVLIQPDGFIVAVGTAFSNGASDDDFAVARYTSTGNLDTGFGTGGLVTTDFSTGQVGTRASLDHASAVALQPDRKIVVGGFTRGDQQSFAVARYNADGSLDRTFGRDGRVTVPAAEPQVFSITTQDSGAIVLAGSSASSRPGTALFTLVRLRSGGTPDESFGSGGMITTLFEGSRSGARAIAVQPDGKLISAGARFGAPSASGDALQDSGFALARYNADGSVDTAFGSGGRALSSLGDAGATPVAVAVQPDGKIIVAGLVFFQVPSASLQTRFPGSAAVAAGLFAIGIACAGLLVRRTRRAQAG